MRQYLKVWGVTVLCSLLFIVFPWALATLGVTNGVDVFNW